MRANEKYQMYMIFSQMLKSFDMEDLEYLYKLVKAKYESTRPVEDLDLLLWDDLKTMFEPYVEYKIYMLVEKKYPLAPLTLLMMLEKKLMIDYESEMAYQLLKFIIKQLKKYIKGTTHLGLWYPKGTGIETVVYADSDHAGDYVDRKSTSGICTFVGCCLTSWFSKKQTALAISTTEAEYVSAGKACQQALWMKQALIDYDVRLDDVPIMCDNKGAIDLSKNPVQHSRTKHIEIRHHFLHDNVQKGHISIEKVSSVDNIADILTKPLKRESFNYLRLGLGMMEHIP
ncbi:hypothetical protein Tco_0143998 [Tanacetum coccineum]